jgi:hypothetical protein
MKFKLKFRNFVKFYVVYPFVSIQVSLACAVLDVLFYATFTKFGYAYHYASGFIRDAHLSFTAWAVDES